MIEALVNLQPTTIAITRHEKVLNEGGWTWTETTLKPITIRLYDYGHDAKEYYTPSGEIKYLTHGFLAQRGVNIVVGHDSYDTFEARGRTYRIYSKREYDDTGVDSQVQCACGAV